MKASILYMGKINTCKIAAAYEMLLTARTVRRTKRYVDILQKVVCSITLHGNVLLSPSFERHLKILLRFIDSFYTFLIEIFQLLSLLTEYCDRTTCLPST